MKIDEFCINEGLRTYWQQQIHKMMNGQCGGKTAKENNEAVLSTTFVYIDFLFIKNLNKFKLIDMSIRKQPNTRQKYQTNKIIIILLLFTNYIHFTS